MSKTSTPVILSKHYDLLLWLQRQVPRFPRSHRFVLGDRLLGTSLDIQGLLVEATYTRDKQSILARAGIKVEQLRFLIRLSHDLEFLSLKQYAFLSAQLEELGRMLGGWRRQQAHRS